MLIFRLVLWGVFRRIGIEMDKSAERLELENVFMQAVALYLCLEAPRLKDKPTIELMGLFGDANLAKRLIPREIGPVQAASEFASGYLKKEFPKWAIARNR